MGVKIVLVLLFCLLFETVCSFVSLKEPTSIRRLVQQQTMTVGNVHCQEKVKRDMCGLCAKENQVFQQTKLTTDNYLPVTMSEFINVSLSFKSNPIGCAEFRICEFSAGNTKLKTINCARQEPLYDETGNNTMFHFQPGSVSAELRLKVPEKINCSDCVLQLKYFAAKVLTLMRRRIKRRLIWFCAVCMYTMYGTLTHKWIKKAISNTFTHPQQNMDMASTATSARTLYDCAMINVQNPKSRERRQVESAGVIFGPNRPKTRFRFSDAPINQAANVLRSRPKPGENAITIHHIVMSKTNESSEVVTETGNEASRQLIDVSRSGNVASSARSSNTMTSETIENQAASDMTSNVVLVRNNNPSPVTTVVRNIAPMNTGIKATSERLNMVYINSAPRVLNDSTSGSRQSDSSRTVGRNNESVLSAVHREQRLPSGSLLPNATVNSDATKVNSEVNPVSAVSPSVSSNVYILSSQQADVAKRRRLSGPVGSFKNSGTAIMPMLETRLSPDSRQPDNVGVPNLLSISNREKEAKVYNSNVSNQVSNPATRIMDIKVNPAGRLMVADDSNKSVSTVDMGTSQQKVPQIQTNIVVASKNGVQSGLGMMTNDEKQQPVLVRPGSVGTILEEVRLPTEDILSDNTVPQAKLSEVLTISRPETQPVKPRPASVSFGNILETTRNNADRMNIIITNKEAQTTDSVPMRVSGENNHSLINNISVRSFENRPSLSSNITAVGQNMHAFVNNTADVSVESRPSANSISRRNDSTTVTRTNTSAPNINIAQVESTNTLSSNLSDIVTTAIPLEWYENGTYDNSGFYGNYTDYGNYSYYYNGSMYYNDTMYPEYAGMYENETMYGNYSYHYYNETLYPDNMTVYHPDNMTMYENEKAYSGNMTEENLTTARKQKNRFNSVSTVDVKIIPKTNAPSVDSATFKQTATIVASNELLTTTNPSVGSTHVVATHLHTVNDSKATEKPPSTVRRVKEIPVTPATVEISQTSNVQQTTTDKYSNINFRNLRPGKVSYLPDYKNYLDDHGGVPILVEENSLKSGTSVVNDGTATEVNGINGNGIRNTVSSGVIEVKNVNTADNIIDYAVIDNVVSRPKIVVTYPIDSNSVALGQINAGNIVTDGTSGQRDGTKMEASQSVSQVLDMLVTDIIRELKILTSISSGEKLELPPIYTTYPHDMSSVAVGMGKQNNNMEQNQQIKVTGTPVNVTPGVLEEMPPILIPSDIKTSDYGNSQSTDQIPATTVSKGNKIRERNNVYTTDDGISPVQMPAISIPTKKLLHRRNDTGYEIINMVNKNQNSKTTYNFFDTNMLKNNAIQTAYKADTDSLMERESFSGTRNILYPIENVNPIYNIYKSKNSKTDVKTVWKGQGVSGANLPSYNGRLTYPEPLSKIVLRGLPSIRPKLTMSPVESIDNQNTDIDKTAMRELPSIRPKHTVTSVENMNSQTNISTTDNSFATESYAADSSVAENTARVNNTVLPPAEITSEYIDSINRNIQLINDALMKTINRSSSVKTNIITDSNIPEVPRTTDTIQTSLLNSSSSHDRNGSKVDAENIPEIQKDSNASFSSNSSTSISQIDNLSGEPDLNRKQMDDVSLQILQTLQTIVKELQLNRQLVLARQTLPSKQPLATDVSTDVKLPVDYFRTNNDIRGNSFDLAQSVPGVERKIGNVKTLATNLDVFNKHLSKNADRAESNPIWQVHPSLLSVSPFGQQRMVSSVSDIDKMGRFQTGNLVSIADARPWVTNMESSTISTDLRGPSSDFTPESNNDPRGEITTRNVMNKSLAALGNPNIQDTRDFSTMPESLLAVPAAADVNLPIQSGIPVDVRIGVHNTVAKEGSEGIYNLGNVQANIYPSLIKEADLLRQIGQNSNLDTAAATNLAGNGNELILQNKLYDFTGVTEEQKNQIMRSLSTAYASTGLGNEYTNTRLSNIERQMPFNAEPLVYVCPNGERFSCQPVGVYDGIPGMEWWCFNHCKNGPCPKTKCQCTCDPQNNTKAANVENMKLEPSFGQRSNEKALNATEGEGENGVLRKKIWKKVITLTLNGSKEDAVQVNDKGPEIMVSRAPQIISDSVDSVSANERGLNEQAGGLRTNASSKMNIDKKITETVAADKQTAKKTSPPRRKLQLMIIDNRLVCRGTGKFENIEGIVDWCTTMCRQAICPEFVCTCWS